MLRVGLTGGIGSGKSMVTARLAQHGAWIIDSDRIAREVLEPGSAGLRAVVDTFGTEILAGDGALDRSALAELVFADADARARLNAIVHPLVAARSAELAAKVPPEAVVVHDVPLLVETGRAAGFPLVVVVHADPAVRLRRLVAHRGMTESAVVARIAAQATDEQRRAVADVWLDNSGCRDDTLATTDRLWTQRIEPLAANVHQHRPAPRASTPVVVAPDGSWPQQAQRVMARVALVAGPRAHRIDHIGSTAVPGLDANDVLDLQVVVAHLDMAAQLAGDLLSTGLVKREGRWWDNAHDGTTHDKAMATNADPARAVNCHIRPASSPTWREALLLRDWLRARPAERRNYADLKHQLAAQQWDSIDAYAIAKTPFISGALDRAERWAARTGWQAA